jgi:hypothetical protein
MSLFYAKNNIIKFISEHMQPEMIKAFAEGNCTIQINDILYTTALENAVNSPIFTIGDYYDDLRRDVIETSYDIPQFDRDVIKFFYSQVRDLLHNYMNDVLHHRGYHIKVLALPENVLAEDLKGIFKWANQEIANAALA